MRDARLVSEALLDARDWSPGTLAGYAEERHRRLEVLALNATVQQRLDVDFSPDFVPRRLEVVETAWSDPTFGALLSAQIAGPEAADPAVLAPAELGRLRTMLYGDDAHPGSARFDLPPA
jgi:hypothetical protein